MGELGFCFLSCVMRSCCLHLSFSLLLVPSFSLFGSLHSVSACSFSNPPLSYPLSLTLPTSISYTPPFPHNTRKKSKAQENTHTKDRNEQKVKKRSFAHLRLYSLHNPINQFFWVWQQLRRTSLSHPCSCERLQIRSPLWDSFVVRY